MIKVNENFVITTAFLKLSLLYPGGENIIEAIIFDMYGV